MAGETTDVFATSFGVLNYSGMLFNKGNTRTPFLTMIAGRQKQTNHVEFVTGQEYDSGSTGSQPAISESESLTAPKATAATRSQKTNVTQIFQESLGVSYAKESNMGTLSGLNVANQQANPMNELDFQAGVKMQKIARDIEYTFINGTYNKATTDAEVNKTRGMVSAITTNTIAAGSKPLTVALIESLLAKIYASNAPVDNLVLWVDGISKQQLNDDCKVNGLTMVNAARNVNGINIDTILTAYGEVGVRLGEFLPKGTVLLINFGVIGPVHQPVPNKGNFFLEQLAKTGAGTKYQIFGQIGLDYGPEWFHGKITGLKQTFTPSEYSRIVKTVSDSAAGGGTQ